MTEPVSQCPFCSISYNKEDIRPLSKKADRRELVHATCFSCHRAMLFAIERRENHVACVGLFTDCNAQDAKQFLEKPKISLEDVLRAHELLFRQSAQEEKISP